MDGWDKLIKAIDAYIAKEDIDLENILSEAGFVDSGDAIIEISDIEAKIARALTAETRIINRKLNESVDLAAFAEEWPDIAALDNVDEVIAKIFFDSFNANMQKLATSYIKQIDPELTVSAITQRTTDWVQSWSEELGQLMKLNTHATVERLLTENLRDGNSIVDFTRQLMDNGIRNEWYRARTASLTEMLTAHSVAQQEAIIQNPACEDKEWVHTGEHRNKPRENHVDLGGTIIRKDQPFSLIGKNGNTYYPMYPRDSSELPASERINCHCIHRGIVNANVLGLSLEERLELQRRAIADDDGAWERELDARNRAKAGIE